MGLHQVVSSKYCSAEGVDEIEDKGPNFRYYVDKLLKHQFSKYKILLLKILLSECYNLTTLTTTYHCESVRAKHSSSGRGCSVPGSGDSGQGGRGL